MRSRCTPVSVIVLVLSLALALPGWAQVAPLPDEPAQSEAPADPWDGIAVRRGKLVGQLNDWNAETKVVHVLDRNGKEWELRHNEHSKSLGGVPKAGTRLQALYAEDKDGKLWIIKLSLPGTPQRIR